jgi:hypothetical protein
MQPRASRTWRAPLYHVEVLRRRQVDQPGVVDRVLHKFFDVGVAAEHEDQREEAQ